ncbi:hypothetical protein RirG_163160 [Rhizophagus irregularis DAOM 197198w]|uniref:Protein kinase domain-containing protein n=1 Tax=Rhizophagus irregularis (strain DAOM 197198w) TaxID=1432141 RepID=A0A015IYE7_RHIIW|nr:hypothetical protein RirG_163160 [Rhizophagus irregularis DAOM 197198w]
METLNKTSKEKPRNLWKTVKFDDEYQTHVTVSSINSAIKSGEIDYRVIYMDDIEKRKETFKENFINWTSGNKDIDELIQHSQLNAVHSRTSLEWIPYEKFQNVTYITRGGFGKIYSAEWPEGNIWYWDIENQKWIRSTSRKVALKSLDNSSEISTDFLNEIKSYLQIYIWSIVFCYGITQDPNTKDYMMVSYYCENGNLRNFYLNNSNDNIKLHRLSRIANGLLNIHNAEKVHKDFHSGNILEGGGMYISDLGMCQPANNKEGNQIKKKKEFMEYYLIWHQKFYVDINI